jgi:hypothetical protein
MIDDFSENKLHTFRCSWNGFPRIDTNLQLITRRQFWKRRREALADFANLTAVRRTRLCADSRELTKSKLTMDEREFPSGSCGATLDCAKFLRSGSTGGIFAFDSADIDILFS